MNNEKELNIDANSNSTLLQEHTSETYDDYTNALREEDESLHEKWAAIKRLHEKYGFAY
jgi:hypothetical protein